MWRLKEEPMEKKYSVQWEEDEVKSVEVDGVEYAAPEDIPDASDRERIQSMILEGPDADFDVDMSLPEGKPFPGEKIIFGVFLGVALLMLLIAGIAGFSTARAITREVSAPGKVVEMVARSDSEGNDYYYPVIEFYARDGSKKTVQLSEGSWPPLYEVGEAVNVSYDPQRPTRAHIQSLSGGFLRWLVTLITGFLGVAFGGAAWMVRKVFWPKPGEGSS